MYSNSKTVDFLEVLNVIFGFLVQKTLLVPIFKVLTRLEVILCTKNFIFLYRDFAAFRNIGEILKMQYFGNRLKLQAQIFRLSSFYDTNNWGKFEENLRGIGNIFNFFWMI